MLNLLIGVSHPQKTAGLPGHDRSASHNPNNLYQRGPGILKYNAGVVPSVFLNMDINELGVL